MRIQIAFAAAAVLSACGIFADDNLDLSKSIEKIELLGGKITRDEALPDRPVIGIDFEGNKRLTDSYLRLLRPFTSLTTLNLRYTRITDVGLHDISEIKTLTSLNLSNTAITDDGAREIRRLANLTSIELYDTQITDVGLREIGELKALTSLNLGKTQITDQGMHELKDLKNLKTLDIWLTRITDHGLKELDPLKNLRMLICGSGVTDSGEKNLNKSLPRLVVRRITRPAKDDPRTRPATTVRIVNQK